jgi:uncharacterized membrane protein YgcG
MKKRLLFLLPAVLLGVACRAQDTANTLPAGVQFPAQLITHLDARKAKVGDEVKLEVTANLRGPGGAVVLPKGAKLIGSVTDARDRSAGEGESRLSFMISKAEWHGGSMALHAAPTAITAPKMGVERPSGGDSGGFGSGDDRSGRGANAGGSGGGRGNDSIALIAAAIAQELKGSEVRDTGDPKTATAIVSRSREVSLPSGTVVTFRQIKPLEQ